MTSLLLEKFEKLYFLKHQTMLMEAERDSKWQTSRSEHTACRLDIRAGLRKRQAFLVGKSYMAEHLLLRSHGGVYGRTRLLVRRNIEWSKMQLSLVWKTDFNGCCLLKYKIYSFFFRLIFFKKILISPFSSKYCIIFLYNSKA